ncbi:translation initiation factor IF-2-like [Schistocerca nitens]|uniref:translation initiation factor IF-2-like n=1 Tax=Schistocerca nitens TaxID=7011 RepID=UPI002119166D|nr:translation initiation factor IF-2-like [Schistocerca nitens]
MAPQPLAPTTPALLPALAPGRSAAPGGLLSPPPRPHLRLPSPPCSSVALELVDADAAIMPLPPPSPMEVVAPHGHLAQQRGRAAEQPGRATHPRPRIAHGAGVGERPVKTCPGRAPPLSEGVGGMTAASASIGSGTVEEHGGSSQRWGRDGGERRPPGAGDGSGGGAGASAAKVRVTGPAGVAERF